MAFNAKRTAAMLGRQLAKLDEQLDRQWQKDGILEKIEAKRRALVQVATNNGLKVAMVQVADGYALYYQARRSKTLSTYIWFYGGGDENVSSWGKVVSVPRKTGDKLVAEFDPEYI
jgi:hypothetical protein